MPKTIHDRLPLVLALLVVCAVGWPRAARADDEPELKGTVPAQWRLVWRADPAHEATICWTTAEAGKRHRVQFRAVDDTGDDAVEGIVDCYANGPYSVTKVVRRQKAHYHHARLTALEPSTRYTVVLESDDDRSPELWFVTAPEDDRRVKILYGGDSRSGREARRDMNRMMAQMVADDPEIICLAHGGDYVATGFSHAQWAEWITDHELTVSGKGRLLPIVPARGNHDPGPLFNQVFGFESGDNHNYYALSLSPLARLITLNTNIPTGGDQKKWLEHELAAARPAHRWVVAQYHRAAWPAVKSPGQARRSWVPLFEEYNVDLVCEADGHAIKRTVPIRDGKQDPTGVVYIGEGGLGVGQRTPRKDHWYLQSPGKVGKGHHVQLLSVSPERLEYRAILLGGKVFDEHVLEAREAVAEVGAAR